MFPPKDQLTICFAHAAYQMKATFDALDTGIRNFEVRDRSELDRRAHEADIIVASGLWHNGLIETASKLKFIQSISAGTDQYDQTELAARHIRLASAAGVNARAVAEHAFGLILAMVPTDISLNNSYFVVGHFHMVLVGGSVMLLFAQAYYWWPKMTGHFLSEAIGNWVFWLMFIGVFVAFFAMHISGYAGMPRRVPVYYADFKFSNMLTTFGYFLTIIAASLFYIDLFLSYSRPKITVDDPWKVNDIQHSFEWATSCPPPVYNFEHVPPIPVVDQMAHHGTNA